MCPSATRGHAAAVEDRMAAPLTIRTALERSGIRRSGGPRNGWSYTHANGRRASAAERARIAALAIPPLWRNVFVARSASARVQVIGQDAAGRWQYRYRESHTRKRASLKFARTASLARALPLLRRAVARDLARRALDLPRVCAGALRLLLATGMRSGSAEHARGGAFGLATLRPRHVRVRGAHVHLRYLGKHRVAQAHVVRNAALAKLVRELLALDGRELFAYRGRGGRTSDLRRQHLSAYLKQALGEHYQPRDLRTWLGTDVCARELARSGGEARAVAATARALGNTVRVARDSYVDPRVLARAGRRGAVRKTSTRTPAA